MGMFAALDVSQGIHNLDRLIEAAQDVPEAARPALDVLAGQLRDLEKGIEEATVRITAAQKVDPIARRLATVPELGPDRVDRLSRDNARCKPSAGAAVRRS